MAVQGSTRNVQRGSAQAGSTQPAQDLGQQVTEKAGDAIEKVSEQARQTAATQKDRLVGGLDATASAIRQTGVNVRRQQPMVADYAEKAASRVDGVRDYLRQHEVEDLVSDVQDYARRNKAVFLGGTMLLGFMAARLVKSGSRRQQIGASSSLPGNSSSMRSVEMSSPSRVPASPRYLASGNSAIEVDPTLDEEPLEYDPMAETAREMPSAASRMRTNGH